MSDNGSKYRATATLSDLSRRDLLRRAGFVGVGALGAGLVGCKNRPEDDIIDTSTDPTVNQVGGTISGSVSGLLDGDAAQGVAVRLVGVGQVTTDESGSFEVRVGRFGDYEIQFSGPGFHKRIGVLRLSGNVTLSEALLESGGGLPMGFLDQYARAAGPNGKEGVTPRNAGATNRWSSTPLIRIYRRLSDSDKENLTDARITALETSIAELFTSLTASRLGSAVVEVRDGQPPTSLDDIPAGTMVIGQSKRGTLETAHIGSVSNPFSIAKARISCRSDSTIEFFNRVFAHGLGGYVVGTGAESILNPAGRANASDRDLLAARFHYTRVAGNAAPDQDPAGVLINA